MAKEKLEKYRTVTKVMLLLWALWWTFFGLGSGIAQGGLGELFLGFIFLASVYVAWNWEGPGSILLIVEGALLLLGYLGAYDPLTVFVSLATIAMPPLVAGVFLRMYRLRPHTSN